MSLDRPAAGKKVIALLTDFGGDSFYVGAMKGAILAVDPDAVIVDISHGVAPHAIDQGSFLLARVFEVFLEGTVFLAVVDPGVGGARKNVIVRSKNRYVVAPDNGLVSDVREEHGIDECFSIRGTAVERIRRHRAAGRTFLGRDVFGPIAAAIAAGEPPARLGVRIRRVKVIPLPKVEVKRGLVRGSGRYVDSFGNVVTNISGGDLRRAFGDHPLERIRVRVNNSVEIRGVVEYFTKARRGDLAAVLDSWNLIELSVNAGSAVERFGGFAGIEVELTRI